MFLLYLSAMASDFSACPICMEDYALETRVPKSLDCRHVLCQLCLQNGADTLDTCPMCRQTIRDHRNLPNDFTMMDYLQRKQGKNDSKKQAVLRSKLQEMSDNAKKELEAAKKDIEEANDTEHLFEVHAKDIFDKCVERWRHNIPVGSYNRVDVESKLERLQHSVTVCMSLLENTYISKEDVSSCETEIHGAVGMLQCNDEEGAVEKATWKKYRQLLMAAFTEKSQDAPTTYFSFSAGKTCDHYYLSSVVCSHRFFDFCRTFLIPYFLAGNLKC